jgi:hypothetical protein
MNRRYQDTNIWPQNTPLAHFQKNSVTRVSQLGAAVRRTVDEQFNNEGKYEHA